MKIMEILVTDAVVLDLGVQTKREVLAEMATALAKVEPQICLLYTSPSPRDLSTSRMPSSA